MNIDDTDHHLDAVHYIIFIGEAGNIFLKNTVFPLRWCWYLYEGEIALSLDTSYCLPPLQLRLESSHTL